MTLLPTLAFIAAGCGGSGSSHSPSDVSQANFILERDLVAGRESITSKEFLAIEMESKSSSSTAADLSETGVDEIPLDIVKGGVHEIKFDLSHSRALTAELIDSNGTTVIHLTADELSRGESIPPGRYTLRLTNDDAETYPLFIVPGSTVIKDSCVGCSLTGADLSGSDLHNVNLERADLTNANLVGAQCSGASFRGADLSGATLAAANCATADFSGSNLRGANLNAANLSHANLLGAVWDSTTSAVAVSLTGAATLSSFPDGSPTEASSTVNLSASYPLVISESGLHWTFQNLTFGSGATAIVLADTSISVTSLTTANSTSHHFQILGIDGVKGNDGAAGTPYNPAPYWGTVASDGSPGLPGSSGTNAPNLTLSIGTLTGTLSVYTKGGNGGAGGNGGNGGGNDSQFGPNDTVNCGNGGAGGNGGNGGHGGDVTITYNSTNGTPTIVNSTPEASGGAGGTGGKKGTLENGKTPPNHPKDGATGRTGSSGGAGRVTVAAE